MTVPDLRPFADEHLPEAAGLLARRHLRHRATEPLLPESDALSALERTWREERTSGAVALRDGEVVGYLIGRVKENRVWGRHAWVERAGHAASEPEIVRDLYAAAAPGWVESGAKLHFALVPALGEALEPWYRLGFGQMQVEAIRESGADVSPPPRDVTIRRGGPADLETAAMPAARLIWEHQALPPSFTGLTPPGDDELRVDWRETLEEPKVAFFVAEREGRVVGHSLLYPPEPDFGTPSDSVYLASGATLPEVRGEGIGLALSEHVLAWAREAGYGSVVTDWRVPNLLASRFWPARGFRPTFHRLHRVLEIG